LTLCPTKIVPGNSSGSAAAGGVAAGFAVAGLAVAGLAVAGFADAAFFDARLRGVFAAFVVASVAAVLTSASGWSADFAVRVVDFAIAVLVWAS
jgi:hypothetical protein